MPSNGVERIDFRKQPPILGPAAPADAAAPDLAPPCGHATL